jgi:hypothetical protein
MFYGRKWRAALRGQANPANWPISGKIAMEFKIFLGQMTSFEVPFCDFIQNVSQAPSMCIFRWIKVDK